MKHSAALLLCLLFAACATPGPPAPVPPAASPDGRVVLTLVNATIEPRKPTGEPWGPPERGDLILLKLVMEGAALILDIPSVGKLAQDIMGISGPARRSPNPFVRVTYQGRSLATHAQARTTVPSWDYPMLFELGFEEEPVTIALFDAEIAKGSSGPILRTDPIGTLHLPAKKLRTPGLVKLGPFGSVKELYVRVDRYPAAPSRKRVQVRGDRGWTSAGVRLIAGQRLKLAAGGELCAARKTCTGPDGLALPKWESYSVLKEAPHSGLLMRIGEGAPRFVGGAGDFPVTESGYLALGPNDRDLSNNKGGFSVELSVE
jgi:hypothetical protein